MLKKFIGSVRPCEAAQNINLDIRGVIVCNVLIIKTRVSCDQIGLLILVFDFLFPWLASLNWPVSQRIGSRFLFFLTLFQ